MVLISELCVVLTLSIGLTDLWHAQRLPEIIKAATEEWARRELVEAKHAAESGNAAEAVEKLRRAFLLSADLKTGEMDAYREALLQDAEERLGRDPPDSGAAWGEVLEAEELSPDSPKPHFLLGKLFINVSDWKSAARELGTAIRIDPESHQAHNHLAFAHFHLGNFAEALKEYQIVVKLHGSDPAVIVSIALCYERMGQRKKACETLKEGINGMADSADLRELWKDLGCKGSAHSSEDDG